MFLAHFAVGLAAKRTAPRASLAAWFAAAQLADLLWPLFLLAGVEHVRIAPGITAFTPLDFYDYPFTHSLVAAVVWAAAFAGLWSVARRHRIPDHTRTAWLLAGCVVSHWILDALVHRPDMPIMPHGPYVGLGLWNSVPATLAVELTAFAAAVMFYARGGFTTAARRVAFWLLVAFLTVVYFGAAFGPPPPDVRTVAWSALALWLLLPWAFWADRRP